MKKIMYTIALVAMGITASYAQKPARERADKLTAEQRAEKATAALQQKLNLTAEQRQKVQRIELDRIKKSEEWRKQDVAAMKGRMEERKSYLKEHQQKLDAVLTADQKKTWEASKGEMRNKLKDRIKDKKGHRGPKGPRPPKATPPPPPTNNN